MVSYRKRGKVWQYEISYKDLDGAYKKLRKSGFRLKSDAELAASQVKSLYADVRQFKAGEIPLSIYFERWINLYKRNSVTNVTFVKYENTLNHIRKIFGKMPLKDITRTVYQERLNVFARDHAPRTVSAFHKQIRAALLDALDEHIIPNDPTRKAVVTGVAVHRPKKALDYGEWQKLIHHLDPDQIPEMMIYLAAVTGMRYAEILGVTTSDINWQEGTVDVNKTWDYKYHAGFKKTKNKASMRKLSLDSISLHHLHVFVENHLTSPNAPLFLINGHAMVSAEINQVLTNKLRTLGLPRVTFHGLRHTHASVLLYQGVSVLSVSKRLGHSSITTTQSTYLHIIKELEAKDTDKILAILENA
ncbi:tyrosine-type recombinase/integrase [Lapidilactobacillus gannanensis]|uniref:Tyrosine-type recombinase/integrase n=1 Tax=Lapidilactobacillus gannanensis TaxID=2486002 RepID=A0ABW4BM95_9LACO|nr:tyrosine-type recombinase/integrase [Lapidilactobacillus gannanensis]